MTTPTIRQSGTVTVPTKIPAWSWRCEEHDCGWLGVMMTSESSALHEAAGHYWEEHAIALCASIDGKKQLGHPGHRWEHVAGSDSLEKCTRCGDVIGK